MPIDDNVTEFAGKEVKDWNAETGSLEPAKFHYRLRLDWNQAETTTWTDLFAAFLEAGNTEEIKGLVVGDWGRTGEGNGSEAVIETLVAARDRLPNLTALFLGDMTYEECEISWIVQSDVSPLFAAYPNLEHFRVRGSQGLSLGNLRHENLKSLIVETGGLPVSVVREVAGAYLPALEHLELWLGEDNYGWDGTLDDVTPLLDDAHFPNLRYLGLRDSEIADEIAGALATAPIMERIRVLDLSLGVLSDIGAKALLTCPHLEKLEKLDLHYHYLSDKVAEQIEALPIEVDLSDQQDGEDEDDRYVAVGE